MKKAYQSDCVWCNCFRNFFNQPVSQRAVTVYVSDPLIVSSVLVFFQINRGLRINIRQQMVPILFVIGNDYIMLIIRL